VYYIFFYYASHVHNRITSHKKQHLFVAKWLTTTLKVCSVESLPEN